MDIIAEPYLDIDFSNLFYMTDTGRRWDGYKVSVRDKIPGYQEKWESQGLRYHSTYDVINAVEKGQFPPKVMITNHPQRWTDDRLAWFREWMEQSVKNQIKRLLIP